MFKVPALGCTSTNLGRPCSNNIIGEHEPLCPLGSAPVDPGKGNYEVCGRANGGSWQRMHRIQEECYNDPSVPVL